MKANEVLKAAIGHMEDRAATYDKPEGERSMPATVAAFNALTGHELTAEQGWLFMTVLKLCRTQQGGFRADNYEDGAAYFALMGEQACEDRQFGEKLIAACQQVSEQMETEKSDPYGPRDAEGWYAWNGDETMRPAGEVFYVMREDAGKGIHSGPCGAEHLRWSHIVYWRPAQ